MKTPEQLAEILSNAQKAANDAYTEDDGGTCNLDDVVFQPGRSSARLKKAFEIAGWKWYSGFKWFGSTTYSSGLRFRGQAACRARMASAAYKYLKEALEDDPIWVGHWQQMD